MSDFKKYRWAADRQGSYYGGDFSVIHFKFGHARKLYWFSDEFQERYPRFCKEYEKYCYCEPEKPSVFKNAISLVDYIEHNNIPVVLYANFFDREFADYDSCREWCMDNAEGEESVFVETLDFPENEAELEEFKLFPNTNRDVLITALEGLKGRNPQGLRDYIDELLLDYINDEDIADAFEALFIR